MQNNGSHIVSMNISLYSVTQRDRSIFEITNMMREDLKRYPELEKSQVNVGGSSGGGMNGQSTLDYEVYGWDFTETDSVAQQIKHILQNTTGIADITISRSDYQPEYHVDFDREKLARYGLNLSTAATYLRNRINGSTASYYREDGEEYDIKVMYAPEHRTSIEDIENILIYNAAGQGIRVRDLGKVVERVSPPTIERKDRQRIITVQGVVNGELAMSEIIANVQPHLDNLDLPAGVYIDIKMKNK
jgi:HAE1 family hydrophobic/amphiphilic exporter-1